MQTPYWFLKMMFSFCVVILVLLVISLPYVERGSGTYVVTIMSFVVTGITILGIVVTVLLDRRTEDSMNST